MTREQAICLPEGTIVKLRNSNKIGVVKDMYSENRFTGKRTLEKYAVMKSGSCISLFTCYENFEL